ncbi:MAG: Glu/Leu/Phe/Val dehydrogenase dimerization domain-containing protein [Desulfobacterales bacterium]|jgi:leucine dehydrogenase
MESLISQWDGESVVIRYDRPTGAWFIIAIHSTRLGPATGGTRMKDYAKLNDAVKDALKLAAGMTYKFAVVDFPRGGGKAVINIPTDFDIDKRTQMLRRYGSLIRQLGGLYETGPDVGTSPEDMDIISETGEPYVFCCTPQKGGAGDSAPPTALGVFSGIQAVCEHLFNDPSPAGKRILVQGAGSVGRILIRKLLKAGAEVLFSDVDRTTIAYFRDELKLPYVTAEDIFGTACDIFSPCALGGILNRETIPLLKCRAVAGAANNQLNEPADALKLSEKGILYAPDYVINAGGAIGIVGLESMGWSKKKADEQVISIQQTLRRIFEMAETEGITTDEAARRIAESRLAGAAS